MQSFAFSFCFVFLQTVVFHCCLLFHIVSKLYHFHPMTFPMLSYINQLTFMIFLRLVPRPHVVVGCFCALISWPRVVTGCFCASNLDYVLLQAASAPWFDFPTTCCYRLLLRFDFLTTCCYRLHMCLDFPYYDLTRRMYYHFNICCLNALLSACTYSSLCFAWGCFCAFTLNDILNLRRPTFSYRWHALTHSCSPSYFEA